MIFYFTDGEMKALHFLNGSWKIEKEMCHNQLNNIITRNIQMYEGHMLTHYLYLLLSKLSCQP